MATLTQEQIDGIWPTIYQGLNLMNIPKQSEGEYYSVFKKRITKEVTRRIIHGFQGDWIITLQVLLDPTIFNFIEQMPDYDTTTFSFQKFLSYVLEEKEIKTGPFTTLGDAKQQLGEKKAYDTRAMLMHPTIGDPRPMFEISLENMRPTDCHLDYFEHLESSSLLADILPIKTKKKGKVIKEDVNILTRLKGMFRRADKEGIENLLNEFLEDRSAFLTDVNNMSVTPSTVFLTKTQNKGCIVFPSVLRDAVRKVERFTTTRDPIHMEQDDHGKISMSQVPLLYLVSLGHDFHFSLRVVFQGIEYSFGLGFDKDLPFYESFNLYSLLNEDWKKKGASAYTPDYLLNADLKNKVRGVILLSTNIIEKIQKIFLDPTIEVTLQNENRQAPTFYLSYDPQHRTYCTVASASKSVSSMSKKHSFNCATLAPATGIGTSSIGLSHAPSAVQANRPMTLKELKVIEEIIEEDTFLPEEMLKVLNFLENNESTGFSIPTALGQTYLPKLTGQLLDRMHKTPESLAALLDRPLPEPVRWRPAPPQPAANSLSSSSSAASAARAEPESWFDAMEESTFGKDFLSSYYRDPPRGSVKPPPPAPAREIYPTAQVLGTRTREEREEGEVSDAVLPNHPVRRRIDAEKGGSKKGGKNKRTIKKRNTHGRKKKRTMKKHNTHGRKRRTAKKIIR